MSDILKVANNLGIDVEKPVEVLPEQKARLGGTLKVTEITAGDRECAITAGLIPDAYMGCEFDIEKVKQNVIDQQAKAGQRFRIINFDKYTDTLMEIVNCVRADKKLPGSYLIGAPNGLGKTSFANTCIMILYKLGKLCTPYVSLSELAELKQETDKSLLVGLSGSFRNSMEPASYYELNYTGKTPKIIVGGYSWSEYINSEVLFTYFTGLSSKTVESHMLKMILTVRGNKGLPTVVFMDTSIDPYMADKNLKKFVFDEIYEYRARGDRPSYDRICHSSCYRKYASYIIMEEDK